MTLDQKIQIWVSAYRHRTKHPKVLLFKSLHACLKHRQVVAMLLVTEVLWRVLGRIVAEALARRLSCGRPSQVVRTVLTDQRLVTCRRGFARFGSPSLPALNK